MTNELETFLTEKLRTSVMEIHFEKKDGTFRKMFCTLAESKIPEDKIPKNEQSYSSEALRVFDVEQDDWRAFRWDSLISYNVKEENVFV